MATTMTHEQDVSTLEVKDKLYAMCEQFGIDEDEVRAMWYAIMEVARESDATVCLECAYHVTRCRCI